MLNVVNKATVDNDFFSDTEIEAAQTLLEDKNSLGKIADTAADLANSLVDLMFSGAGLVIFIVIVIVFIGGLIAMSFLISGQKTISGLVGGNKGGE